jgi:hypothetical protein
MGRNWPKGKGMRVPVINQEKGNVAPNKQKSYKTMIMKMFAILDKAKPDIESIKGLLKLGGGQVYDRSSD